jgi:hypothetical protein
VRRWQSALGARLRAALHAVATEIDTQRMPTTFDLTAPWLSFRLVLGVVVTLKKTGVIQRAARGCVSRICVRIPTGAEAASADGCDKWRDAAS